MSRARGLTMVRAGAGSGKTYRLTHDVCDAVAAETPVDGLVAVTFTTKAAAELEARIRRMLVEEGEFDRAQRLPLAYLGTVHAVCLRLIKELALDAGLSPRVDVVPDAASLLREALEHALEPALRAEMNELAARLGVERDELRGVNNWLWPVSEVMELARGNRIRPGDLPRMAEQSAAGLLRLLPTPVEDGAALDGALRRELTSAIAWLETYDDGVKKTAAARAEVLALAREIEHVVRLPWPAWAKLAAIQPADASIDRFRPLIATASDYPRHPAFHEDLRRLTIGVFRAAQKGMESFATWKHERGLVDYVDMIDHALDLLERDEVAADLRSRLRLVVVDEFQDTSPLQLALFTRLHGIAGRSIWVGDRKQCIFEFAGADPALIDAVASWTSREGGETDQLPTNRRSRPELVDLTSAVFAAAMAPLGYEEKEVVATPHRGCPPELASLPPLGIWWLDAAAGSRPSAAKDSAAIAEGVRRLLEDPAATPVVDRATDTVRAVRPGDIAVLVDTNDHAEGIAGALVARGIAAAIARPGLLSTPEGTLVDAALRWLLDPQDSLSEAILEALSGFDGRPAEEWLAHRIDRATDPGGVRPSPAPAPPWRTNLESLRDRLEVLSPIEAVDLTLEALDALGAAAAWPEPSQRRCNLDALRALAAEYEERSHDRREAATVAGLLRFFDETRTTVLSRAGESARDEQHVATGDHAVTVCTYHKAKGLEWPVVILASLGRAERRTAFGVHPESASEGFNPDDPLGGRTIRYWPRPLGSRSVPLVTDVTSSPEGQRVSAAERHERVRLLYVGMTRARDHLVLTARITKRGPSVAWLDELADATGRPLLDLARLPHVADEGADGAPALCLAHPDGRDLTVAPRVWTLDPGTDPPERLGKPDARNWLARPVPASPHAERPRYRISPSRAADDWPTLPPLEIGEIVRLGPPLDLTHATEVQWSAIGNATHAFLACDDPRDPDDVRRELARSLLTAHDVLAILGPDALVTVGNRLRTWLERRWPKARWHRELPVEALVPAGNDPMGDGPNSDGPRLVSGTIDLLLDTPDGILIIDHKTFPAPTEAAWRKAAAKHAPQLAAYAAALAVAHGRRVAGTWLHFPLGGGAVALRPGHG
ncbi:MAG: UvrD-helicase domain-containing protein [Deltaproteobacteria bacterium]|nr:UvrD-helicase domain-containing protein [Deltaproteobacteria bacterium]